MYNKFYPMDMDIVLLYVKETWTQLETVQVIIFFGVKNHDG